MGTPRSPSINQTAKSRVKEMVEIKRTLEGAEDVVERCVTEDGMNTPVLDKVGKGGLIPGEGDRSVRQRIG